MYVICASESSLTTLWDDTGAATNSQETLTFLPTYQALPGLVQPTTWPSSQLNPHLTDATGPSDVFLQEETNHIIESLTWDTSDPKILAASASDISDIKVGMKVSHKDFLAGTVVTDVNGAYITVSNTASIAAASASGEVTFSSGEIVSDTFTNYKTHRPSENNINDYQDYQNDIYWPNEGKRYGLDPQHAQINGSYYIDCVGGKIHFSSNLSGKTIVLKYLSSQGYGELRVHKFAEEAIYKAIICDVMSSRANVPEYAIRRYKKEKFSSRRNAKLRLSNIKLEELIQVLRGKSKQIKH